MQAAQNIAETGLHFNDSLTACDIYKINKGPKQPIHNGSGKSEITERLQLVSTDLLGSVTLAARGNYRFITKYFDHYTRFKAVYLISAKDKALTTLVKFVQDFVMPLGLRLQHLWADGGNEFVADYSRGYCKTTASMQQFSPPKTPEYNGISERDGLRGRDGRTIVDDAQCTLHGAALPKFHWSKRAATVVFLLNRPPSKTIGGDKSYYRMFGKHVDRFFLRTTGTRPHGGHQAHISLTSRHTRSPHPLQLKQQP